MKTPFDYAREAIGNLPPAIEGQEGSKVTFHAACECVRLGLGDGDAMSLLAEFNRRCSPPWTEKELKHKLAGARRAAGGQVRQWHRQAAPAVRMVWRPLPRVKAARVAECLQLETNEKMSPVGDIPSEGMSTVVDSERAARELSPMGDVSSARELALPNFADLLPDAPHLAGWHRDGTPIFQGTQAEWQEHFTPKS